MENIHTVRASQQALSAVMAPGADEEDGYVLSTESQTGRTPPSTPDDLGPATTHEG